MLPSRTATQRRGYSLRSELRLILRVVVSKNQPCRLRTETNGRGDLHDSVGCLTMFGRFTSSHSTHTNVKGCWHEIKFMRHFAFSLPRRWSMMLPLVVTS